jgi:hypothetical protein
VGQGRRFLNRGISFATHCFSNGSLVEIVHDSPLSNPFFMPPGSRRSTCASVGGSVTSKWYLHGGASPPPH